MLYIAHEKFFATLNDALHFENCCFFWGGGRVFPPKGHLVDDSVFDHELRGWSWLS